jgi:Flavodoxin
MRALIVYESMYGNTRRVADAIGAGLSPECDVTVVPVAQAEPALVAEADLVIVGGPTHAHGMSRSTTRSGAAQDAKKPGSELALEPGADGHGLREWFSSLGQYATKAAAFDTRMPGPAALTGRASKGIDRMLHKHGFDVVAGPESFLVSRANELQPGEDSRAKAWGAGVATRLTPAAGYTPV